MIKHRGLGVAVVLLSSFAAWISSSVWASASEYTPAATRRRALMVPFWPMASAISSSSTRI